MVEMQERRGRPGGKQFPARLVTPVSVGFKRQVIEAAGAASVPAAEWIRQACQDRLDHQIRVLFDGKEGLYPLDYDF